MRVLLAALLLLAGCASAARHVPEAESLSPAERDAYADAVEALDAGDAAGALAEIETATLRTPWHVPSHMVRQDALVAGGRADVTRAWYAAEAARNPDDLARALLAARLLPRTDGAREIAYRDVVRRDPAGLWPRIALAYELVRRAHDDAARATDRADGGYVVEAQAASDAARIARAEAASLASAVAREHPRVAEAQAVLADVVLADSEASPARRAEAVRAAEFVARLDPQSPAAWERVARARRAASDDAAAVEAYAVAADLAPADARIRAAWGRVLLDLRRDAEAASVLSEAAALAPGDVEVALNHAVALYRTGDLDGAVAEYERAAGVAPGDPRVFEGLALAHSERGDAASAAAAMERYLAAGGSDRDGAKRLIDAARGAPAE